MPSSHTEYLWHLITVRHLIHVETLQHGSNKYKYSLALHSSAELLCIRIELSRNKLLLDRNNHCYSVNWSIHFSMHFLVYIPVCKCDRSNQPVDSFLHPCDSSELVLRFKWILVLDKAYISNFYVTMPLIPFV